MSRSIQIRILLIRHGETAGNLEGRYVGRTDEELCSYGRQELEQLRNGEQSGGHQMPGPVSAVFASPMKRCIQSAQILFPGMPIRTIPGMQECDFGEFEYHNYKELTEDPSYQDWIDSGGTTGFPGGEEPAEFRIRVCAAFETMVEEILHSQKCIAGGREHGEDSDPVCALICHGGCIMAIMDRYAYPHQDYFSWQLKNGQWLEVRLDPAKWSIGEKALSLAGNESNLY